MYKTSFRASLFVIILMLPAAIYAAGLGKLTLNSALGQPLNAEIDIVATDSDEIPTLKAGVATREAFAQAGINYESILSTIKVSIESRTNGIPYIKLTSPQAVNDPFLMILMELSWSSGRILREYTALLDPAEANTQSLAAANPNPAPVMVAARLEAEKAPDAGKGNQAANKSKASSSGQIHKTYGPVSRGDTLSSIARQVLPDGVNLNQMLVALYRANRDAFIADNMNLLRTGAVLNIPERSDIAAIDTATAKAEIKMQVGDWRNYQGKLAALSKESPAPYAISQSDQGKITTSIDKKPAAVPGAPKEILKLSSGAQLPDKDGRIADSALVDRLRMMEEDAIARNLALKEANERVTMLEKSIENLKQLLELKDSVLAQAQIKAESTPGIAVKPEVQPPVVVDTPIENDPKLEAGPIPVREQGTSTPQPATAVIEQTAPVNPPLAVEETADDQSITDLIFENIEYVAASSILALLLILLILKRRRKQLQEEAEEEEAGKENFSSAMRSRMASMAAAQAVPVAEEDPSASENMDDDLTYQNINSYSGATEQEEEFEKDSVYYEENSEFQTAEESSPEDSMQNNQPDDAYLKEDSAADDDQLTDSQKGDDSANEIDFDLSDEADQAKQNPILTVESDGKENIELSDDFEPSLDAASSETSVAEDKEEDIVFEFADSAIDLTDEKPTNEIEIPAIDDQFISADGKSERFELMDEPLEFDETQENRSDEEKPESLLKAPELELADINLDLEDLNPPDEKGESPELNDKSEQWQEVETKLDLAKAYQEMDDKEGAKEMLEEVIRDGDAKQKKAAKKMLKSL